MKKVLVIAPYSYLPHYSGGQKLISEFVEHLAQHTELTVVSTIRNDPNNAIGYRLLRWLPDSFYRYLDIRVKNQLERLLKAEKFDGVIWEHPYYYWIASYLRKKFNIFTIIHTHNIEYQRFRSMGKWWWPILKRYEGAFLKMADQVYFISPNDMESGISEWNLPQTKCDVLPFGIPQQQNPTDREACQQRIREQHRIPETAKILLFNGLLSYPPNRQALDDLLQEINPRLLTQTDFEYRLVICGKDLPASYQGLTAEKDRNVIFAGFVEDIETYFKGADVFLNPVLSGGGIKTKMVESIGFGTTVVSTITGSTGIVPESCDDKLKLIADSDWDGFCEAVVQESSKCLPTPEAYYERYNWGNVVKCIPKLLSEQTSR
ncbi:MAG: glycosyltransferase family 4 protein [Bacteroidota bacterium]